MDTATSATLGPSCSAYDRGGGAGLRTRSGHGGARTARGRLRLSSAHVGGTLAYNGKCRDRSGKCAGNRALCARSGVMVTEASPPVSFRAPPWRLGTMQSLAWEQCTDEGACLVTVHDV